MTGRVTVALVVDGEPGGGPAGAALRGQLCEVDGAGRRVGPVVRVDDVGRAVAGWPDATGSARWLWASTTEIYPPLLRAGVRVDRCHDLELVEALLLGCEGRWGEPRSLAAVLARRRGAPVPPDPVPRVAASAGSAQGTLFDTGHSGVGDLDQLLEVHADQLARARALPEPGRLRLLLAAESAGALIAAEMGHTGLPWRAEIHDALLLELLGEPSPMGGPPRRLVELTERINAAFGGTWVHPDSPAEVVRAFTRLGIPVPSTRAWVLRQIDHPVVPLLLEYKELYRIWTAHGWAWREQWVHGGRFRAEYVPAGVVSGRWASRGGGALQIPKVIRRAVVADPGWTFVVADAGQLEPRVLAAVSGDRRLAAAAATGDLYAALAADAFGGDRARAKVALLGAMYGQTGGQAAPALAVLRRSYPTAWEYVESAARSGEQGGLVRSWLGRTCPPPSIGWGALGEEGGAGPTEGEAPRAGATARARGRFTRNFVIQATAAEWALVLLARLRAALRGSAELVFFQHDEVVVHCRRQDAPEVLAAAEQAGAEATRLLFGDTPVRFPLQTSTVDCYADAK